jgi:hypothetical protein
MAELEAIGRRMDAERWLVARLIADRLDAVHEVTATAVVDSWETLGVLWVDRRNAFPKVQRELRRLREAGDLASDELRPTRRAQRRVYYRP